MLELFINADKELKLPKFIKVFNIEVPSCEELREYGFDANFRQYQCEIAEKDRKKAEKYLNKQVGAIDYWF